MTTSRKEASFTNVKDRYQPFMRSEKHRIRSENNIILKDKLKQKAATIIAAGETMPPVFKPYTTKSYIPSLVRSRRKIKQKEVFEPKSLLNVADLNTTQSKDALENFTKMTDILNTATKSSKNMNKVIPGLEGFKKEEKSANIIKSFIKGNIKRKKQLKEFKEENKIMKSLANTFDVSQFRMKEVNNKRKEKVI